MPSKPNAEKQFQNTIVELLGMFGYEGTHVFPLRDQYGVFRTPTTAPGWPDLVYLRPPRQLAIEVKLDGVTVPKHQRAWLTMFGGVPCCRAWVIRPSNPRWETFVEWVRHPKEAPQMYGFEPVEDPSKVLAEHKRKKRAQRERGRQ